MSTDVLPPADGLGRDGHDEHDAALAMHLIERHGHGPEVYDLSTLARVEVHDSLPHADHTHTGASRPTLAKG